MCSNVVMAYSRSRTSAGEAAFEAMYRRELAVITALGASLTGDDELGADLAHEAMLRAYREWWRVGVMDRPGAWVRRVVINLARDVHRREVRERRGLARLGAEPPTAPTEPTSEDFWAEMRRLPDRQRAAMALQCIGDMTVREIANVLGVSDGTVKTSLFAARKKLAVALEVQEDRT